MSRQRSASLTGFPRPAKSVTMSPEEWAALDALALADRRSRGQMIASLVFAEKARRARRVSR